MCAALLVVDDNRDMLALLTGIFTDEGHQVTATETIEAAVTELLDREYDLIIADSMHPVWDPDLPVVKELKSAAPLTPIVLFTAHRLTDTADPKRAGLEAVWPRPIELEVLLASLNAALDRNGLGSARWVC